MLDPGLGRAVPLEQFDKLMLARYGVIGLREPKPDFDENHFRAEFAQALRLIDIAPAAGEAVRSLVWSITPVGVEGPDYDTGYSDPALPFSIFIGAHAASDQVPAIRLAEGVLHEAMHLQLSLIEDLVPLAGASGEWRYSPWRKRERPIQGVLHGLYVFRVVQDWLRVIVAGTSVAGRDIAHAQLRISKIDEECAELTDLAASNDLTPDGQILAAALVD
ncbi:MAG: aKG-HExxH-type peptide beta-hydroxylase [Sphingomonas sp.]|uniref:aKG-HExxH-type peptide beta-hydroxylase n=1 Tax=Sphingomonas sp. TaxID=28214 RepID=UPI003F7FDA0C